MVRSPTVVVDVLPPFTGCQLYQIRLRDFVRKMKILAQSNGFKVQIQVLYLYEEVLYSS